LFPSACWFLDEKVREARALEKWLRRPFLHTPKRRDFLSGGGGGGTFEIARWVPQRLIRT